MDGALSVGVLGPLRATRGGEPVDLGPARQQLVLGLLLLAAGTPVSRDRLVDVLWSQPPANAVNKVQGYVSALRRRLEPDRPARATSVIERVGDGYAARLEPEQLDLGRFDRLVSAAGTGADDDALDLLLEALAYWRGGALANLGAAVTDLPETQAVEARGRSAVLRAGVLAHSLHRGAEVVDPLRRAATGAPLDEDLHAGLVRALAHSGRQADALATFRAVRARLAEELGVEPGRQLAAAHAAVLDRPPDATPAPRPAQLPRDLPSFTGRSILIAALRRELRRESPVVVLSGTGGVGKTALAVHVGHQLDCPDGTLFADLAGASDRPADPGAVLGALLGSLGVPGAGLSLDARAALFRSTTAGRRLLLVLDDARDAAQVRPLLPGAGCVALVTSRSRLTALAAATSRLTLGTLSSAEATKLLVARLGERRVAAEPQATDALATACGRIPLALQVAAGRLAIRPQWTVAAFTERLSDERTRLDELQLDDLDVRASLRLSTTQLEPGPATAFRTWALTDVRPLPVAAAAAMLDVGRDGADRLVERLVDIHLIEADENAGLRLHDLARTFGRELADADQAADRAAALARLGDWYATSLQHAMHALMPGLPVEPLPRPRGDAAVFADVPGAVAWLAAEHANVVTATLAARPEVATLNQIAALLTRYGNPRGHSDACERLYAAAAERAVSEGDELQHAAALLGLGSTAWARQDRPVAGAAFDHANRMLRGTGDRREAVAAMNLGVLLGEQGRLREAVEHLLRARRLYEEQGDRYRSASAVNNLARVYSQLGDHGRAMESVAELRRHADALDDVELRTYAHNNLGAELLRSGQPAAAIRSFRSGLRIGEALRNPRLTGFAHAGLARAYRDVGLPMRATHHFRRSIDIYEGVRARDQVSELRAELSSVHKGSFV